MLKPSEMARRCGVTVKTLQAWDRAGKLKAYRTPTNMRYYTEEQYNTFIGASSSNKVNVGYTRVSNAGQKDDLKNQIDFLRQYANGAGVILESVITDIGSGLSYSRKNWNALLDRVVKGEIESIYITFKDRFVRFGYDWFETFCGKHGTKIVVLNNPDLSPTQEMVEDLVSIIHVFSCRIYGLHKYKKQIGGDVDVTGIQNRDKADTETD